MIWRIADILDENYIELKFITAADMGTPVGRDPRLGAEGILDMLRYYAGRATKITGETLASSVPGMLSYTRKKPVASILPFDSLDEVARRANATEFGLAGGIWTRDIGKAHRLAELLHAGTVWVNTYNMLDPAVPFGGYKMSGWGKEGGRDALDAFLNTKAVWTNTG